MESATPSSRSPWPGGVGPIALGALALSVVTLLIAIILRAVDSRDEWILVLADLHGGLALVARILVVWTIIVFLFAYIRRQDADRARFSIVGTTALWFVIGAWVITVAAFAVNNRDESLGERIAAAFFGQALGGGALEATDSTAPPVDEYSEEDFEEDYSEESYSDEDYSEDYSDEELELSEEEIEQLESEDPEYDEDF
jgi:hypothetical protein